MSVIGIGEVADLAKDVIGRIWPDKTEKEKAELAAALSVVQSQIEVNKTEAASPSIFVAGWRPAIGWICGAALGYTYIVYPLLLWGCAIWAPAISPPKLVIDGMIYELLFGMLGMAGLRSFDKMKGTAR